VLAHGGLGDRQVAADLPIGQPSRDLPQQLLLSRGNREFSDMTLAQEDLVDLRDLRSSQGQHQPLPLR
jgi:hypothetical protein